MLMSAVRRNASFRVARVSAKRHSAVRCRACLLLAALVLLANGGIARAALVWGGGTNVWDNTLANFTGAVWVDGGDALFAGGVPATVKVDSSGSAVNVGSISVTAPGYTIEGNAPRPTN